MTLQNIHTLPSGWLIHYAYAYDPYKKGFNWMVGLPSRKDFLNTDESPLKRWILVALAVSEEWRRVRWSAPHIDLLSSDRFEPMPPQDIVKYLNCLTQAGAEFLKELRL
jgi:hypothetical protein